MIGRPSSLLRSALFALIGVALVAFVLGATAMIRRDPVQLHAASRVFPNAAPVGVNRGSTNMPVTIQVGPAYPTVELLLSNAPDFETRVNAVLGKWGPDALKLAPRLALVRNQSERTLVAYSITFRVKRGRTEHDFTLQLKYPDAVAGGPGRLSPFEPGREIRPGEERVVAPEFEIDPGEDNRWLSDYVSAERDDGQDTALPRITAVGVSLDAVIFDDGSASGPAASALCAHFTKYLDSKQDLYQKALDALHGGESADRFIGTLMKVARPSIGELSRDPFKLYPAQAAGELAHWNVRYQGAAFEEVITKAIRTSPFTCSQ